MFVTRLVEFTAGVEGRGEWDVSGEEDFFRGHFPGDPVVPGVLIGEGLAQVAGLVGLHVDAPGKDTIGRGTQGGRLVHIDVRFDRAVRPPAVVSLRARLTRELGALRQFEVSAEACGERIARGMLTLAEVEGGGA